MKVIEHLVNGEIVSMGDPTQDVFNPSTGEVSKQVSLATKTTACVFSQEVLSCFVHQIGKGVIE